MSKFQKNQIELKKYINLKTRTKDSKTVLLESNVGNPEDTKQALKYGSEGIGLFRSEFLYMGNDH
ncbi:MAG: hypothetical protein K2L48_03685 [Mycoplasmoidaceae bacterium]|nr:hypothetical protein [Mycoplasmoidaceae bacterium]